MEWNQYITTEFIDAYKANECLWKISSKDYKNKNLRNAAYKEIVKHLKKMGGAEMSLKQVREKIQNLRRAVRSEKRKVDASRRSGTSTDKVYTPTLWYYNLLEFTNDLNPINSFSNLEAPTNFESVGSANLEECVNIDQEGEEIETTCQNFSPIPTTTTKSRKRKIDDNISNFMEKCAKALETPKIIEKSDEFDAVGIQIAAKLRKMNSEQVIYAEFLLHKVCMKGQLQQLTDKTDLIDI